MNRDYIQEALLKFNIGKHQWYGFRKTDDNGDTIPNDQRMKYEHLILNDDISFKDVIKSQALSFFRIRILLIYFFYKCICYIPPIVSTS